MTKKKVSKIHLQRNGSEHIERGSANHENVSFCQNLAVTRKRTVRMQSRLFHSQILFQRMKK